jgi:hypothetical protein
VVACSTNSLVKMFDFLFINVMKTIFQHNSLTNKFSINLINTSKYKNAKIGITKRMYHKYDGQHQNLQTLAKLKGWIFFANKSTYALKCNYLNRFKTTMRQYRFF